MKLLTLAFCSALVSVANGAYWELGPCPPMPPVVDPFDVERFTGDWYTAWKTPVPYMPDGYSCTRAQYGSFEQGINNISVYNSGINPDGTFGDTCGWAQPVTPLNATGELKVYFYGNEGSAYWILDTDYDTYASGYACTNRTVDELGEDKYVRKNSAWILTRDRNPPQELIDQAFEIFDELDLMSFDDWEVLPQSDDCVNDNTPSCKDEWPNQ